MAGSAGRDSLRHGSAACSPGAGGACAGRSLRWCRERWARGVAHVLVAGSDEHQHAADLAPQFIPEDVEAGHDDAQALDDDAEAVNQHSQAFDGGAGNEGVDSVLATLAREHVPATFFLTGDFCVDHPGIAARLVAAGSVGNHTYDHPHLPQLLSDAAVKSQVTRARTAILNVTGEEPRPLFRFPYGDYNSRTLRLVNGLGYVAVGWTVDTLGWKGEDEGITAAKVVSRVIAARTPGEIVLMHLGAAPDKTTLDADALPRVISSLRSYGYGFVTLDQLRG